jgi:hypothetical protein
MIAAQTITLNLKSLKAQKRQIFTACLSFNDFDLISELKEEWCIGDRMMRVAYLLL